MILAAYREWGAAAPRRLEGEYAFVLWDDARRELLAARDLVGRRPLYVATLSDGGLAVADAVSPLLAIAACPRTLNPASIAGVAAGLPETPWDTAYASVALLPAGATLRASVERRGA